MKSVLIKLILVASIYIMSVRPLPAQIMVYSDTLVQVVQGPGDRSRLGTMDATFCNDTLVTGLSPVNFTGLTFHPNRELLGYGLPKFSGTERGLYRIDYRLNVLRFVNHLGIDTLITGLACDYGGEVYAAGMGITRYDFASNTFQYVGDLPANMQAGGAFTFREGKYYLSTINNTLVEVDIENPMNSTILASFPNEIPLIDGLLTYPHRCDSIITYAIGRSENGSTVYELSFDDFSLTEVCQTDAKIFAAAFDQECIVPPCEMYVDLDSDGSSGADQNNYISDNSCTTPISISDQDIDIFSLIDIDSIVIELTAILDGNLEYLEFAGTSNLSANGSGTAKIVLVNLGTANTTDFEEAIRNIFYQNDALTPSIGNREINFQVHASVYNSTLSITTLQLGDPSLQINATAESVDCFDGNDGRINLQAEGGMEPYLFQLENGQTGNLFENLGAGTYQIILSDANDCIVQDSITIFQPDSLSVNITNLNNVTCNDDGRLLASPSGGIGPYLYEWSNGNTDSIATGISDGTYHVDIVDNNRCIASSSIDVEGFETVTTQENITLCQGETFQLGNEVFTQDTLLCNTSMSSVGCDSLHCINVQFLDSILVQESQNACIGESINFNGLTIASDTTVCLAFQNVNGCDSTYCLSFSFIQKMDQIETSICEGEIFAFNNLVLSEAGIYLDTLQTNDGCDSILALNLVILSNPQIDFSTSGSLCNEESVIINPGNFASYNWSTGSSNSEIEINAPGVFTVNVTDEFGCQATDSIHIVEENIEVIFQTIPVNCFGNADGQILIDTVLDGNPPYVFKLNNQPFQSSLIFGGLSGGTYQLTIEDVKGCSRVEFVIIDEPTAIQLDLENNINIRLGDTLSLEPFSNTIPSTIQWSPSDELSCDTCLNTLAWPSESTQYVLTIGNDNGCKVSEEVFINIDKSINIYTPNAFSPNGDGINDYFAIYSDQIISNISSLKIFDRWGSLLFEQTDLLPNQELSGWDGKVNNQSMPVGVYVYVAELTLVDGTTEQISGDFVLVR